MRARALLLSVLGLSAISALGCGLGDMVGDKIKEKASEEISEKIVEVSTGAKDVELDKNGAQVTLKTDEGTVQINGQGGGSLPDGFPLPAYAGATISGSTRFDVNGKTTFQVAMSSTDAPKAVGSFYETELKGRGYQVNKVEMNANGQDSVMLQGEAADTMTTVAVTAENGQTTIGITVTPK